MLSYAFKYLPEPGRDLQPEGGVMLSYAFKYYAVLSPEQEAAKNNTMTIAMNWAFNNYNGTVGYRYYRSLRAMSKDGRRSFHLAAIFNRKAA